MPAAAKNLVSIKKVLRDNKALLREHYHISRIGIFGSWVRGDMHKRSDLDVLVEFSEPISLIRLVALEHFLTGIVGLRVDVVPKDDIRRELRDRILEEAVYL